MAICWMKWHGIVPVPTVENTLDFLARYGRYNGPRGGGVMGLPGTGFVQLLVVNCLAGTSI